MPLLLSPIDGSAMRQINRYGIEIDVCPTSGGIWLDKGELEKLMALLREEQTDEGREYTPQKRVATPMRHHHDYDRDDDSDHDDDDRYRHGHRKKSKMSRMMDIFDF